MSRHRLSKRVSRKNFTKHALYSKAINFATSPMRGGIRL